ncbi:T-complex protein 11-domain-containing protein [Hygrophoropsis aurantiaca]|uniref:T-complex protein 11-domain-containing protein n=1 Tax=Hygrophoropsis aurantiaca TaxID=72124 RepID=A0ACB8AIE3_9AGAM|nr:T-complex protein 11-domain-containing protein [Hygrophoropsis aurantiaca]
MDAIILRLSSKAEDYPDDSLLRETISLLSDLRRNPEEARKASWNTLKTNLGILQDKGIWEQSEESDKLLEALKQSADDILLDDTKTSTSQPENNLKWEGERFSITIPPTSTQSPLLPSNNPVVLPLELVQILNHAYFLHLLATDPQQVLPTGKSLLSVMSRPHDEPDVTSKPSLRNRVEDIVHRAFWDEATESLSNPEPSSQLPRLKSLYNDLYTALTPLLPSRHAVLVTLSSPLSPTSSPLNSAIMHLREVAASLRARCAPVRDSEIAAILQQLDEIPSNSPHPVMAKVVTSSIKSILKVAEVMKDDLSQFVLGSMSESQLRSVIAKQAKTMERDVILDIWHADRVSQSWTDWLETHNPQFTVGNPGSDDSYKWLARLVQSLGESFAVSCTLPTTTVTPNGTLDTAEDISEPARNALPGTFFFSTPTLLAIQNYLQALVIAASLRSLTRLPLPSTNSHSNGEEIAFMERLWALLDMEMREEGAGETKLAHLADEIIRARKHAASLNHTEVTAGEEATLRAAVDRTLKPNDPVFALLQKRLLTALLTALVQRRSEPAQTSPNIPERMQTGRDGERKGKRPRLAVDPEELDDVGSNVVWSELRTLEVKGFEDPILSKSVRATFQKIDNCLRWVESVWGDVIYTVKV